MFPRKGEQSPIQFLIPSLYRQVLFTFRCKPNNTKQTNNTEQTHTTTTKSINKDKNFTNHAQTIPSEQKNIESNGAKDNGIS